MAVKLRPFKKHALPRRSLGEVDDIHVQPLDTDSEETSSSKVVYAVFALLILLGIATGYVLSRGGKLGSSIVSTGQPGVTTSADGKSVGSGDSKTFKDSAEGTLEAGGLNGEGTHKLIREGGPSQTVYLISSVVDLDSFVGKKVKVWGETQAAKKAAWLMDVGKVEME